MGDCRLCSLVGGHDPSAQSLEIVGLDSAGAGLRIATDGDGKPGGKHSPPKDVHGPQQGTETGSARRCDKERLRRRFPQTNTRLSKANLEIWFYSVNIRGQHYDSVLVNRCASTDNEGQFSHFCFSKGKPGPIAAIAGGKFSTNEFYSNARTSPA